MHIPSIARPVTVLALLSGSAGDGGLAVQPIQFLNQFPKPGSLLTNVWVLKYTQASVGRKLRIELFFVQNKTFDTLTHDR